MLESPKSPGDRFAKEDLDPEAGSKQVKTQAADRLVEILGFRVSLSSCGGGWLNTGTEGFFGLKGLLALKGSLGVNTWTMIGHCVAFAKFPCAKV